MRNDLRLSLWKVESESPRWHDDFLDSVFFLGNGRMGARGYIANEPDCRPTQRGLFVAGIFGEIKPGITDFVNLPTPIFESVLLNHMPAVLSSPIHRTLDLRTGILQLQFSLSAGEATVEVCQERFFMMDVPSQLLQRTIITPGRPMSVTICSGIDTSSCNSPIPDDQVKENTQTVQLSKLSRWTTGTHSISADFLVAGTGLCVTQDVCFASELLHSCTQRQNAEDGKLVFAAEAVPGRKYCLDKITCVKTSRDIDSRICSIPSDWSYTQLHRVQQASMERIWCKCNRDITGIFPEEALQCALRYAAFQLLSSCSKKDPTVSIGARGITHMRYKGCYFWDTDLFMLPFFLDVDPEAAHSLCEYRVRTLPAAKRHAAKMNGLGARYPWMAAFDGSEQCETWDIGCSELHVTADVVYAIAQYCEASGDTSFYLDHAAEVFVETARFWVSRYTDRPEEGHANLLFCKGPDEYCGITNNNLFTNVMVQNNLELAVQAANDLCKSRPSKYAELSLSAEEIEHWQALCKRIYWPRDPVTGHLTQDDTFHLLEPVCLSDIKQSDEAAYHAVCFDRLQRYKVIKQADVLLLMTRFRKKFSAEEKEQAWADFEPLCLHDSTLSFATHALFAAMNNKPEQAKAYLRKALLLDLRDIMGNTGKEGLHLACMGESWNAIKAFLQQR